jgi:hypothetical protein
MDNHSDQSHSLFKLEDFPICQLKTHNVLYARLKGRRPKENGRARVDFHAQQSISNHIYWSISLWF